MFDLRTLTTTQLERLRNHTWERMTRGDGYQPFGYDRRTLKLTKPGFLAILDDCQREMHSRIFKRD